MSGVHPCDRTSSPVSSNILVLSQPTTWPPPLVHSVRLASSANIRWWVEKQVPMWVSFFVAGSYMASWRPDRASGNSFAEGWFDPSLHTSGLSGGRTAEVIHTRPFSSNIGLWTLLRLVQAISSPRYVEGCAIFGAAAGSVPGSRTVRGTRVVVLCAGSSTGR